MDSFLNNTALMSAEMQKYIKKVKAEAVMEFVDTQVGAFEAGFVETNKCSIYSMYRFAQHHVKDNYGVETKTMAEQWGEDVTKAARDDSE